MHLSASAAGWIAIGAAGRGRSRCCSRSATSLASGACGRRSSSSSAAASHDLVDFAVSLQAPDRRPAPRGRRARGRRSSGSTGASTTRSRRPRSSATTPTRTRAAISRPRSRCSTRPGRGVVLSAIQGRDYARIYVKEIDRGRASVALSPRSSKRSSAPWPRTEAVSLEVAAGTFGAGAAGSGLERQLRAAERVHGSACPRAALQGQGRGGRAARPAAPLGNRQLRLAPRDPAHALRPGARARSSGRSPAGRSSPATAGAASTAAPRAGA